MSVSRHGRWVSDLPSAQTAIDEIYAELARAQEELQALQSKSFLEWADALGVRFDAGRVSTPGTGATSYVATVNHDLGAVPAGVLLTTNNGALLAGYTSLRTTSFQIVVTAPAVGAFGPAAFETSWLAWG